jgi:esterase
MGGKAAMVLDKLHQGLVSKLVLVDIAPVTYSRNFENYLKVLLSIDLGIFKSRPEIDSMLSKFFKEISFRSFLIVNLKSLIKNAVDISEFPAIKSVSYTDTLFLYGESSEYRVADHIDIIKEHFPLSEFAPLKKAGHWVHVEKPTKFLEIVTKFLKTD